MSIIGKSQLAKEGFVCFAGPFLPYEEPMIPAFLKDAEKANKQTRQEKTHNGVYLWQKSNNSRV